MGRTEAIAIAIKRGLINRVAVERGSRKTYQQSITRRLPDRLLRPPLGNITHYLAVVAGAEGRLT